MGERHDMLKKIGFLWLYSKGFGCLAEEYYVETQPGDLRDYNILDVVGIKLFNNYSINNFTDIVTFKNRHKYNDNIFTNQEEVLQPIKFKKGIIAQIEAKSNIFDFENGRKNNFGDIVITVTPKGLVENPDCLGNYGLLEVDFNQFIIEWNEDENTYDIKGVELKRKPTLRKQLTDYQTYKKTENKDISWFSRFSLLEHIYFISLKNNGSRLKGVLDNLSRNIITTDKIKYIENATGATKKIIEELENKFKYNKEINRLLIINEELEKKKFEENLEAIYDDPDDPWGRLYWKDHNKKGENL